MILNILIYLHFKTNDMYEIIERNDLGIRVRNNTEFHECKICKYSAPIGTCKLWHRCVKNSYYLTDQEAATLEAETTPETVTINDMYIEAKLLFDCQDKLNDLKIENKQLKERIKELKETARQLESRIEELEQTIENMKAIAGEKIESVGIITSVDYPSDNTTELIEVFSNECGYIMQCTYCKEKHSTDFQSKFNFCPNCGRKIVR